MSLYRLTAWSAGVALSILITLTPTSGESLFTINDPTRGLVSMHPALVKEQP